MLEGDYKDAFSYIVLLCPTFSHNVTYKSLSYHDDPNFFPTQCDQVDVVQVVTSILSGTNTLIILDDVASSQAVKNSLFS